MDKSIKAAVSKILMVSFLFVACQNPSEKNVQLMITNRTSYEIDSVVISHPAMVKKKLKAGDSVRFDINTTTINSYKEGIQSGYVFFNKRKIFFQWGFHDWGHFGAKPERVYVFNHGINHLDRDTKKPEVIELFLLKPGNNVDSIYSTGNPILFGKKDSSGTIKVVFDYTKFENNPVLSIRINGMEHEKKITSHDFENWDDNRIWLYYDKGTIKDGVPPQ